MEKVSAPVMAVPEGMAEAKSKLIEASVRVVLRVPKEAVS
jgi:hypothetical protein